MPFAGSEGVWGFRERRNHRLKYESDCLRTGISIKIWIVEGFARDCSLWVFCHPRRNPTEKFISGTSFQSRCVSHMKIANVHIGTIHQNMRIALQFSYWFAIFISVCNPHFLVHGSYVDVCNFHRVCNFHMSLQFSYQFAILTSRLQRTSYVLGFVWIPM